jgi:hypothetical protein
VVTLTAMTPFTVIALPLKVPERLTLAKLPVSLIVPVVPAEPFRSFFVPNCVFDEMRVIELRMLFS